ncbi:MAG: heme exporter protein CcmD [Sphingomonas sp.]|nr:heme exporter protein CcmD [Sphingomonas sp.]
MNHWPFIIAAYALALTAAVALTWWSWTAMRRAEAEVDRLRQDP